MQAGADTENGRVFDDRYTEAEQAGLQPEEALCFANSSIDIGLLRKLVAGDCPPRLIAQILF